MSDLLLHPSTEHILEKTVSNMPQALLLSGKQGTGLETIARDIARKQGDILAVVLPKKKSGSSYAVDEAEGSIIIDDIRLLNEQTRSRFQTKQFVIINIGSRQMSHQAQNAFLKLLEEPRQNIHFLLVSSKLDQLLPTILSRCQKITVLPITSAQTSKLLDTLHVSDPTKRARIMFIAAGLADEITKLAQDEEYYSQRVQTVQDAKLLLEGDQYTKLITIQKYKDKRPGTLQLIDDCLKQLHMVVKKSADTNITIQIEHFIEAYEKIQRNANIQLQLTRVLL